MSTSNRRGMLLVGLVAVLLSAHSTRVFAQPQNIPQQLQQVFQALAAVQASLNALGTAEQTDSASLAALQSAVNTLTTVQRATVQFTPAIYSSGASDFVCEVLNKSNETRHVKVNILNFDGTQVESFTFDPGPGQAFGLGTAHQGALYCRFEVLDGTAADIRANAILGDPALLSITLSVDAR